MDDVNNSDPFLFNSKWKCSGSLAIKQLVLKIRK